jgi:hypothetical protein
MKKAVFYTICFAFLGLNSIICLAQTDSLTTAEENQPIFKGGCSTSGTILYFFSGLTFYPNSTIDSDVLSIRKYQKCDTQKIPLMIFLDSLKLSQATLQRINHLPYQDALTNSIYKFDFTNGVKCPIALHYYLSSRFELKIDGKLFKNQRDKELALRQIKEEDIEYIQTSSPAWIINGYYGTLEIYTKEHNFHLKTKKSVKNMLLTILENQRIKNDILRTGEIFIELPSEFVEYKKLLKKINYVKIDGKKVKIRLIKQKLNQPCITFLNFIVKKQTLIVPCTVSFLGSSVCSADFYAPDNGKYEFHLGVCTSH